MSILIMLIPTTKVLFSFPFFLNNSEVSINFLAQLDYPTGYNILSLIQMPGNFVHQNLGGWKEITQLFLSKIKEFI